MRLLIRIFIASNHTKRVTLSYQKCMTQPTPINLHPNECSQELHYYPFLVKLDSMLEDLNLRVFNMITGINELKALTKHMSCECKCKFDGRKCNSYQQWNSNKCRCVCKKCHVREKEYIWNPARSSCENGKYLANIMNYLVIIWNKIIEPYPEKTKFIPTSFNKKKAMHKTENLYVLLSFSLITIALLMTASIFCCLIKHRAKQKYLLSFHFTNNELKEIMY